MKKTFLFLTLSILVLTVKSQDISEFREDNRTGVSSETGLLKTWPAEGPKLLWTNTELKTGYSSVSFGNGLIYITGTDGQNDILYALDMTGKMKWQAVMGRAWNESYPESRATPTVQGKMVYTCSGYGDLACIDGTTGKVLWSYKGSELNRGTYGRWGIAESLVIDGDKLYYSPGGPETATIALNKGTGAIIWKSKSLGDKPGYVSPILVQYAGYKMLVNVTLGNIYAVNTANGDILWKVPHQQSSDPNMRKFELIKCTTPLYNDGMVYVTGGYDTGGMMVKIADDGKSASVVWTDATLDDHHGGVVLINGYIYGSNWVNNGNGNWCCIDWNTGKTMWEQKWNNKGSLIAAEGMLYIYDEKGGNVGLVKAAPEKFNLVSSFKVTQGNVGPFWAHPVIHNGILYLRHNNALMAYDIKAK
ncbi:MAG TPA: PQQ-binding-like beta-propeller repeat protein [Bacteroidales bacterium]|nr:PQQ-binding-like beta-propeller repeat protein [Bacteroidales bacterium]